MKGYFHNFLGDLGAAQAGIMLINDCWDRVHQRGIIRVNNKFLTHSKAALALIDSLEQQDVIVRSLGVSGILKKAKNKYGAEA